MNLKQDLAADELICKVKVKATQLRIAAIIFKTNKAREIQLLGTNQNGTWHKFKIAPDERLIGCRGFLSHNNNLVGIGFTIWTPENSSAVAASK